MYLSDNQLRELLPSLQIETRNHDHIFDADSQIQPCSIDLRLDTKFWRQKSRRGSLDLRRSVVEQLDARRYWQPVEIEPTETITLKPSQMLAGRVYERFTIPNGYAGKIEGRSSFARLGLMVHCGADFINPGYRGHMPLQLVNVGTTDIRLTPYLPICQLILIKLTSDADKPYGHDERESKYVDDDGGPSYWWKDKNVKKLEALLVERSVPDSVRFKVNQLIGKRDIDLIERFEHFVYTRPNLIWSNPDEVIDAFSKSENWKSRWASCRHRLALWAGPALLTLSIGAALRQPYSWMHYTLWAATPVLLLVTGWRYFFCDPPGDYLTPKELQKIEREIAE